MPELKKVETVALPVKLTEAEVLERSREMASKMAALEEARARHKAESKRLKEIADTLEDDVLALGRTVKSGEEDRQVECEWKADLGLRTLKLVRRDTGEVVRSKAMTPEELEEASQGQFPFVDNVTPLGAAPPAGSKKPQGRN